MGTYVLSFLGLLSLELLMETMKDVKKFISEHMRICISQVMDVEEMKMGTTELLEELMM